MFRYIEIILVMLGVIGSFFVGSLRAKNKELEEKNERKDKQLKEKDETQKRIIEYDNTPIHAKRSWLRSYRTNKDK